MRIADKRMYARKGLDSRASAGRQSADVLLKILSEQSPSLGVHLDQVTTLADGRRASASVCPRRTSLPCCRRPRCTTPARPPSPTRSSTSPARSTTRNRYIRGHTLIGERILSAAPALRRAAKLVRSSHERHDGKGYPDGLVGDQIPLGSRIIAVCDAYDAMVSDRPYRASMGTEKAVAELRRCAGTQFDPAVVEVLCELLEASKLRTLASG